MKVIYPIEVIEKDDLKSICAKNRIKSREKFKRHIIHRSESLEGAVRFYSQYEMSEIVECSRKLTRKMDNVLVSEDFMKKDSYVYFRWEQGERTEVSEEEYKNFWLNNAMFAKCLNGARLMYNNGDIDLAQLYKIIDRHSEEFLTEGVMYSRMRRYVKGLKYTDFMEMVFGE